MIYHMIFIYDIYYWANNKENIGKKKFQNVTKKMVLKKS